MITKYKHKNITDKDLSIPGIGIVRAGEEKEMPDGFNNANFVKVKEKKIEKENVEFNNKNIK
jgi:hypothetical protein